MANLVTNLSGQEGGQVGLETLLQTYDRKKNIFILIFSFLRGQRMASEMSANNPDFIESLRRNMGNRSHARIIRHLSMFRKNLTSFYKTFFF